MIKTLSLACIVWIALIGAVRAGVPFLNATCPGDIEVHADKGGPIYINGNEAKLTTFNANAYEAKYRHVTVSLTVNPDGSPELAYTKESGANGICTVSDYEVESRNHGHHGNHGHHNAECPPDVSQADRYKYPACN